jgi:hypothetical protein
MRLYCVHCGAAIVPADVDLQNGLATCAACNKVFNFVDRLPKASPRIAAVNALDPLLPQPPRMKLEEWGRTLRISWRWFAWSYVALAGFCVFWDGFLIFWYSIAFANHGPLMMKLFPALHLAVGVSLTYSVLTGFLNRTVVEVNDTGLSIWHGPLPWWGNRQVPKSQIEQLFCEKTWPRTNQNQPGPQYQLCATMGQGNTLRLLGGFRHLGEPRFLEQQIEKRLGIKPLAVVGECID